MGFWLVKFITNLLIGKILNVKVKVTQTFFFSQYDAKFSQSGYFKKTLDILCS
jgi:hypothetical protein